MRITKEFLPGEKIIISELVEADHRSRYVPVTYTVIQRYPHHVLCKDAAGNRRCIQNAELLTAGAIEPYECAMPGNGKTRERKWNI